MSGIFFAAMVVEGVGAVKRYCAVLRFRLPRCGGNGTAVSFKWYRGENLTAPRGDFDDVAVRLYFLYERLLRLGVDMKGKDGFMQAFVCVKSF